jgi:hypothetical protein
MELAVVLLFVLPLLVGFAVGAVRVVEFVLNRDLVATGDIVRTVVAILGLGFATFAGWFVMIAPNYSDTGSGFTWAFGIPILVLFAVTEGVWIRIVCRQSPRPILPSICAVASVGLIVWFAINSASA